MRSHVMSVERVLSHGVEKCDFLVFLSIQIANRVVSELVTEFDLSERVLSQEFLVTRKLVNL